jgi:PII-like signaling protein
MDTAIDNYLLRIFIGESDRLDGRPLYEWLVQQAKARGMAGATVLRGMMGFGAHSRIIHTFKIERLSEDLPIVIEIVDAPQRIEDFLSFAEQNIKRGMLVTVEKVQVRVYRGGSPSAQNG